MQEYFDSLSHERLFDRRIVSAAEPIWEETTALLVGPAELNAQESLQLKLWDSGKPFYFTLGLPTWHLLYPQTAPQRTTS